MKRSPLNLAFTVGPGPVLGPGLRLTIALVLCLAPGLAPGLALVACSRPDGEPGGAATVRVLAAASLTDVMTSLASQYEALTGARVTCSFAASSTLARQIEAGAPADVFISADTDWMDRLQASGLLSTAPIDVVTNRLALVTTRAGVDDSSTPIDGAAMRRITGRIALGDPSHVPAGRYARAALESLGVWEAFEARIVATVDVRAALRLVELDSVDAAVVYATDAIASDRVHTVGLFPPDAAPAIRYPAAVVRGARDGAEAFVQFLAGPEATAVFTAAGFRVEASR